MLELFRERLEALEADRDVSHGEAVAQRQQRGVGAREYANLPAAGPRGAVGYHGTEIGVARQRLRREVGVAHDLPRGRARPRPDMMLELRRSLFFISSRLLFVVYSVDDLVRQLDVAARQR